jgi:predicted hydrocarbon binding protein
MTEVVRAKLGSYMSIECFRYLRFGAEDTAGRALIISAGKQRGHSLKDFLKDVSTEDVDKVQKTLTALLGLDGTRLCLVEKISRTTNGFEVLIAESACCSGSTAEEPVCAYTLGVFIGAFEVISGKRMMGTEPECNATGHTHCLYRIEYV